MHTSPFSRTMENVKIPNENNLSTVDPNDHFKDHFKILEQWLLICIRMVLMTSYANHK